MARLSYFPLYTGDWLTKVSHLTLEEQGAYMRLLCCMWNTTDCSLPLDDEKVARAIGCNLRTWRRIKAGIWEQMTLDIPAGVFWQDRIRKEWVKAKAKVDRMAKAREERERKLNGDLSPTKSKLNPPKTEAVSNDSDGLHANYRADNQIQNQNTTKRVPARRIEPSEEAKAVALYLADAIRAHSPDYSPRGGIESATAAWAREIDLAIRLDKRTPEQLRRVIDYAHRNEKDTFWRDKLLSGEKLRDKCAALLLRAKPAGAKPAANYWGLYKPASEAK